MKCQALFSSNDKSEKLKCRLPQFLFGALRVKKVYIIFPLRGSVDANMRVVIHFIMRQYSIVDNYIYIRFCVVAGCGGLVTGACVVTGAGAAEEASSKVKSKVKSKDKSKFKSKFNSKFKTKRYKTHLSYFHGQCHITSFESLLYDTRHRNKITILDLPWLEHCCFVYHGCFELVLAFLGKKTKLQIWDNVG